MAAKNAFVSKNNKPVKCLLMKTSTGLLAVDGSRKYYKHVKSLPVESFQKNLEMAKDSLSLICSQKQEGPKISRLHLFQIDHISLKSADS